MSFDHIEESEYNDSENVSARQIGGVFGAGRHLGNCTGNYSNW